MSRRARGFTLIEMMIALGAMIFVMAGATLVIIASVRGGRSASDRATMQGSARTGIDVIASEIQLAGLGLPKRLAFKPFDRTGGECKTPVLELASLDYRNEWAVSIAGGDTSGGTATLSLRFGRKLTPTQMQDTDIAQGEWVFLYQNGRGTDAGGGLYGHGFARAKNARAAGDATLVLDSTNYSTVQSSFSLGQTEFLDATNYSGHQPVLLRSRQVKIAVHCTGTTGYVYLSDGLNEYPLATNVEVQPLDADDTSIGAKAKDVVGLRFRFFIDQKDSTGAVNPDGVTDDVNADGVVDYNDLVIDPAALTPVAADMTMVTGIEILIRVRGDQVDRTKADYRYQDYVRVVSVPNLHTSTTTPYVFIDADGL